MEWNNLGHFNAVRVDVDGLLVLLGIEVLITFRFLLFSFLSSLLNGGKLSQRAKELGELGWRRQTYPSDQVKWRVTMKVSKKIKSFLFDSRRAREQAKSFADEKAPSSIRACRHSNNESEMPCPSPPKKSREDNAINDCH